MRHVSHLNCIAAKKWRVVTASRFLVLVLVFADVGHGRLAKLGVGWQSTKSVRVSQPDATLLANRCILCHCEEARHHYRVLPLT